MRRRLHRVLLAFVPCVAAAGALSSSAHAERYWDDSAKQWVLSRMTVSVEQTAGRRQLVFTGSAYNDRFITPGRTDQVAPVIVLEGDNNDLAFDVAPSAASRCTAHEPTNSPENYSDRYSLSCNTDGIALPGQAAPPLRFELGGGEDFTRFGWTEVGPMEINAGPGNDGITGGLGNDIIRLGDGDDGAEGYHGDDLIYGEAGNDYLGGGQDIGGADRLEGGTGNDWIIGGGERDEMIGGPGDDFVDMTVHTWWDPDAPGDSDEIDVPSSCGPGNDTLWRYDETKDPLTADASCETDVRQPHIRPTQIRGTLAAGSTLTAARPLVGAAPVERWYSWITCDDERQSVASGCKVRSTCQTFALGQQDVGKLVRVHVREVFSGSGGRYRIRTEDLDVGPTGRVGALGPAGPQPGPDTGAPALQDYDSEETWQYLGDGPIPNPRQHDDTGGDVNSGRDTQDLQTNCPRLNVDGTPVPAATPAPTVAPTPTVTPSITPAPSPTPAAPNPTPVPQQEQAPPVAPGPTAGDPQAILRGQASALSKVLAEALDRSRGSAVRKGGVLEVAVVSGTLSVELQVRARGRWVRVARGSARAGARKLVLRPTAADRRRLAQAPADARGRLRARAVVRLRDAGTRAVSTRGFSLRR